MNDLCFDISNSKGFLQKLIADFEDFEKNAFSSRLAINAAMTAWHLSDWVYHEFNAESIKPYTDLSNYAAWIKTQCKELQIMHDIANGSKHCILIRHIPKVAKTEMHYGVYGPEYSNEHDVSMLVIQMKNGTNVCFEEALKTCVDFWVKYLQDEFGITLQGRYYYLPRRQSFRLPYCNLSPVSGFHPVIL